MKMIFFIAVLAVSAWGQILPPTVEYVKLVDNGHIVRIDGKLYLAIDDEKAKELLTYKLSAQEYKLQAENLQKIFSEYRATSLKVLESEREKSELELTKVRAEVSFFKKQYEDEKRLRETFESSLRKCGSPWLFGYRFCKF